MTIAKDIFDSMYSSLNSGGSVQKTVKAYIAENSDKPPMIVAGDIAHIVGEFKTTTEIKASTISDDSEKKGYQKTVNNIINDVSRIVRETLGFSIVNKKRTHGVYEYIPTLPKVRAVRSVVAEPAKAEPHCSRIHFDSSKHMPIPVEEDEIATFIHCLPEEMRKVFDPYFWNADRWVEMMQKSTVDLEEVGRVLVRAIKAARSSVTTAEAA